MNIGHDIVLIKIEKFHEKKRTTFLLLYSNIVQFICFMRTARILSNV